MVFTCGVFEGQDQMLTGIVIDTGGLEQDAIGWLNQKWKAERGREVSSYLRIDKSTKDSQGNYAQADKQAEHQPNPARIAPFNLSPSFQPSINDQRGALHIGIVLLECFSFFSMQGNFRSHPEAVPGRNGGFPGSGPPSSEPAL